MSMDVRVSFYSYFKDFAGTAQEVYPLPAGSTLDDLYSEVAKRHPRFAEARKSCLMAVGLDYERPNYQLKEGDDVSLFPPVQGG